MDWENIKKKLHRKPKSKKKTTRQFLIDFMKEQRKFNKAVIKKLNNVDSCLDNLENRLNIIIKLNNLRTN